MAHRQSDERRQRARAEVAAEIWKPIACDEARAYVESARSSPPF
jgi:hypothetical protein